MTKSTIASLRLNRRRALGAGAALGVASLARAAWADVETPTFEVLGVQDPQVGGQLAVAQHFNLFKKQGLDVNVHWTQSIADVLTIMGSGTVPVGFGGSLTQILFASKNMPIKTISSLANIAATQGLVLGPKVKLSSPKDLVGKKLAFTEGSSHVLMLAKVAKQYGFDESKVSLVNMNQSEGVVAAARGDVDGLLGWEPNLARVVGMGGTMYFTGTATLFDGKPTELAPKDRLLYVETCVMASQAWIDTKPNTLAALLRALREATDIIQKERPRAIDAIQAVLKIDRNLLEVMVNANKYAVGINEDLRDSHVFQGEWAMKIKRITAIPAPASVITTKIAEMVDPALVTWRPT